MAGRGNFLYENLITSESMISVSSLRVGIVTGALKTGAGSAIINTSGAYSGTVDLEYIAEIDSIAGGAEVGQATFKWSDGGGDWDATGVLTSAVNILLNNGIYINHAGGAGADFVVGDKWYFKGINLFNAGKLIDLDRDHRYRSAALGAPNTITINLGSAQEVKALIIFDHNFTSGVTLTLEADDAATFDSNGGNPQFTESVSYNAEKIIHYLSVTTTRRYWRLKITDAGNSDGYIEAGELYLGSYLQLTKGYAVGFSENIELLRTSNKTPYGVERDRFYNQQKIFLFEYNAMPAADVASLKSLITSISSRSTGIFKPFWFNPDEEEENDTYFVKISSLPINHLMWSYYNVSLELVEVVTSV